MTESTHTLTDTALPADFSAFYARYAPRLLVFFTRRTFDAEVACDLTAEAFAEAYRSRGKFRGSSDKEAAGWLYAIASHQLTRFIRRGVAERRAIEKLGIEVPSLSEDDYARINDLAGLGDLRALVAEHFAQLSPEQQEALRLRVVDELPYVEVAQRLHISEQTARARVSRGLRQLSAALHGLGPMEVST